MTSDGAALAVAWDAAFNATPAAAAELFAEDASYTDHRPLGWEPLRGRGAIRAWFETLSANGATIRAHSRLVEETPPWVLVEQHFGIVAGAIDGGGEGEVTLWVVLRTADGLIAQLDLFEDRAPAVAMFSGACA